MNSNQNSNIIEIEQNKVKSKAHLKNIRNKYIIMKIFDNLSKIRILSLIKYNKKFQKIAEITTEDYKYFSEIEIELIPTEKAHKKFINIEEKKDKPYYHIYLHENKHSNKIIKINIIIDYQVKSLSHLFYNIYDIESIKFIRFYRNNIYDMSSMFERCSLLKELDLSNFNTKDVTDMHSMFEKCYSLIKLDVSNFNIENVTDMNCMFKKCIKLEELNLFDFNSKNDINMNCMFSLCTSMQKLNISYFNINNETTMWKMFFQCPRCLQINIKSKFKEIKDEAFDNTDI